MQFRIVTYNLGFKVHLDSSLPISVFVDGARKTYEEPTAPHLPHINSASSQDISTPINSLPNFRSFSSSIFVFHQILRHLTIMYMTTQAIPLAVLLSKLAHGLPNSPAPSSTPVYSISQVAEVRALQSRSVDITAFC